MINPSNERALSPMARTERELKVLNQKMDKMLDLLGYIYEEIAAGNGRQAKE